MTPPKVTETAEGFSVRLRYGQDRRGSFLIRSRDREQAERAAAVMKQICDVLIRAGRTELATPLLAEVAAHPDEETVAQQLRMAEYAGQGTAAPKRPVGPPGRRRTFRQVAVWWTSGQARRDFPDHVTEPTEQWVDVCTRRLEMSVYPVALPDGRLFGDVPIGEITRRDCDEVMRRLPVPKGKKEMNRSTRRQYAQTISRLFHLAELAEYIDRSPLPRGWVPRPAPKKRFPILYPDEDRLLLGCARVPLWRRLLYGYLHREGGRLGEAEALRVSQFDLTHGTITLDENKTGHSREWKLSPGVLDALLAWFELRGGVGPGDKVFIHENGGPVTFENIAVSVRADLKRAGVERADLFTRGATKGRFGPHCLRRSMVTRNLALGRPSDWVRQRTGHTSGEIDRYRQRANGLAELNLGDVDPLVDCIPELRSMLPAARVEQKPGSGGRKHAAERGFTEDDKSNVMPIGCATAQT